MNTGGLIKVGTAAYFFKDGSLIGTPNEVVKRVAAMRLLKMKVGKYIMSFRMGKYITAHNSAEDQNDIESRILPSIIMDPSGVVETKELASWRKRSFYKTP